MEDLGNLRQSYLQEPIESRPAFIRHELLRHIDRIKSKVIVLKAFVNADKRTDVTPDDVHDYVMALESATREMERALDAMTL